MKDVILGTLAMIGIAAAAVAGIVAVYAFIWVIAYPDLGNYCKVENTVKSTKLTSHSGWDGDHYTTTFMDGSEATTSYVKPGEKICIEDGARFWFWQA